MRQVYAASSGSYSDYSVLCLFDLEEDATAYINAVNENNLKHTHDRYINGTYRSESNGHADPFSACVECESSRSKSYFGIFIETFDFYEEGEIPVADQSSRY